MARFALMITAHPFSCQGQYSALRFAQSLLAQGHQLESVFFSGSGVLIGSKTLCPPADELDLRAQWQQLATTHKVELNLCSSAALKHGILDSSEAVRQQLPVTLASSFLIAGLGCWVEATLSADRCVHFPGASL